MILAEIPTLYTLEEQIFPEFNLVIWEFFLNFTMFKNS